ncbi:MAG: CHAT domain-containing protein [Acidobacteria bacterium]|nr:CHAT domain-containing protein [Acidobacteriota bacterium]
MSFITDTELRSYLLGNLADAPRQEIEDTLLVSDEGSLRLELAEEDLIEDFLDGQLDAEQTALFQSQFLCTSARKEKLAYLQAIRQIAIRHPQPEQAPGNVVSFPAPETRRGIFVGMNRSSYLKLAAAILLLSSAGFLVWRYAFRSPESASLVALNRAYAGGRTLETRIGGFDYAPYAPTRGADEADANARILRERAERIVLDAYAEHPTAANRHALGKYYLADKQFDKAIEQFNAALKETPTVAELHNDLGAALLEKSKYEKRNDQPGDSLQHMAASLESIEQALKLQPNYPAAVFNRALCLQEMYLPRQAIEEWKKYLQLDNNSKWADEARRRLAELEKAPSNISKSDDELYQEYLKDPGNEERTFDLFCQAYSTTGNGITERLIDDYLAAQSHGDAAATDKLNLLEQLGKLIYQRTTDSYVRDVARYYRQLPPRLLPKLIEARQHLNRGRDLRSTSQSQAASNYEQAISLFRQAQDSCEVKMTTCLLARSHLRQSNLDKSQELFAPLAGAGNPYLWLRCESLNGLGELFKVKALSEEAIRANQSALSIAQQIGNTNQRATNLYSLAVKYFELGNFERSFVYQQQAIETVSQNAASHQQHWATNAQAAFQLFSNGFYAAALAYQQEALAIELTTKRQLQLSRTFSHLGVMLGKVMRFAEAIPVAQEAVNIGIRLGNERLGIEIQAYSGLFLADLQRESGNQLAAFQSYERVLSLNNQLGILRYDFEAYRGKALAEIALGWTEQAKRDLATALAIFEQNRNQIVADNERTTYLDKEYETYDAAISLAYAENPQAAFDLSERGRALTLLEVMKGGQGVNANRAEKEFISLNRTQKTSLQMVQQRIPPGTSLLEFTCLSDRLIVFGVSATNFTHNQNLISLSQLEQKVQAFRRAVSDASTGDDQTKILAAELYQILIEPLEPFLSDEQTVCVVPDKILHYLPFAALFSARQQKYLIETRALVTAPSASVFLLCLEHARQQGIGKNGQVLAVGNPQFDPIAYPQLSDLSAATDEANEVAAKYIHRKVLTAEQATEEAVKSAIKRASIIHLATHGVIDERSWANSRLVLAKSSAENGEDGALRAYEIAQMRLPNARLVVLSACQSGVERVYRGEGMIGLGRAFLSAGATSVVASFWAVDSDVSAVLMTDFHKQLKAYSVSQALRHAQLNMLHSANVQHRNPYYWAAFSVFGGDVLL